MSFGHRASILAGVAARLMGWRPDEFWHATPAELASALRNDELEPVASEELAELMALFPDKVG